MKRLTKREPPSNSAETQLEQSFYFPTSPERHCRRASARILTNVQAPAGSLRLRVRRVARESARSSYANLPEWMRHVLAPSLRTTLRGLTRFTAHLVSRPRLTSSLLSPGYKAPAAAMNSPASPRAKRKTPHSVDDRPLKHHRVMNGSGAAKDSPADDNTPENLDDYDADGDMDVDGDESPLVARILHGADTAEWQATIQEVVRNVVSIRFCQTCSFDTEPALTSEATGFVVDAEKGYARPLCSPAAAAAAAAASPPLRGCRDGMLTESWLVQIHPDESPRRRRRTLLGLLHIRQPRGGRCVPRLPRPRPRLRHPKVRSVGYQIHARRSLVALPRSC